jgi:LAO/AO transport system kinase
MIPDTAGLADAITHGASMAQRRAMAKAITLLESNLPQDRDAADAMLTGLLPYTGKALRLGVSGVPGVGKSTFIEALGLFWIGRGHRVAVLAVDPSSSISGGSILGDKTRMERLSVHAQAFIRPSPAGGNLGGVAECTRESMLVCEAAGYDIVIVETVGVGQGEIAVAGMVDLFALMLLPNAGDELQAIKRGVMEVADILIVNKADLDPDAATRAQALLVSTVRLLASHPGALHSGEDMPEVLQVSALQASGIEAFCLAVELLRDRRAASGALQSRRTSQSRDWLLERLQAGLRQWFWAQRGIRSEFESVLREVQDGGMAASTGARRLLGRLAGSMDGASP